MHRKQLGLGWVLGVCGTWALASCSSGSAKLANLNNPTAGAAGSGAGGGGKSGAGASTGGSDDVAGAAGEGSDAGGGAGDTGTAGTGGSGGSTPGAGVGDDCSGGVRCRSGLECLDEKCSPSHSTGPGRPCVIQPECRDDLQCIAGNCVPDGSASTGEACLLDDDCAAGLKCLFSGLSASCEPQGSGDLGDECGAPGDCFGGLTCTEGECAPEVPGSSTWSGVECEDTSGDERVRAYFEIPGAPDADEGDFYRLPFPNDVRRNAGTLDLSGFPTPGNGILGLDALKLYADAIEANDDGWGTYSTVYFRFSGLLDVPSLRSNGAVNWVDVTPGAPEYGSSAGLGWFYSAGRNPYICEHWIGIRRPQGRPLEPGHTYAVWLTNDVVADGGDAILRAPNLLSVLAADEPANAKLKHAHQAYAPFRSYLMAQNVSPASVLAATVFTVGEVRNTMAELADAVTARPAPTARDWVKCEDGVDSPCPDSAGDRNCGAGPSAYDEYHALVRLPIFQEGTLPYAVPADGGNISIASAPEDQPTGAVCLSLTVPTGTAPGAGWPLVVFAHGTGGSFRSHVTSSVAGNLSAGDVKFAVLGIDQVEHGPRRGRSEAAPDQLFFNFMNPKSARGNPLQGAADQLSLARFAATLDGTGSNPAKIDPAQLFFFGHSQGATEGSLMLPYADAYKAAVLSGNGASLMDSLVTKTKPVNVKNVLPLILSDLQGVTALGSLHPALSLLQSWIDPADPLNYARITAAAPLPGHTAKHLFQTYGLEDSYATPVTLATYAIAAELTLVEPERDEISIAKGDAPLSANLGSGSITAGVRQYAPEGERDGHFVVFDDEIANEDMVRFFSQATTGVPQIGE